MGGDQLKRGKSTFWSKFILLIHLTDYNDVYKVSLITKITKNFEFPFFLLTPSHILDSKKNKQNLFIGQICPFYFTYIKFQKKNRENLLIRQICPFYFIY